MAGHNFGKEHSIEEGDMSASINGTVMECRQFFRHSLQAEWSGAASLNGTIVAQASNDGGTTWTTLSGTISPTGASGSGVLNDITHGIALVHCELLRAAWVRIAGTGTLNVYLIGRGL